jgi:hypothetical protein
MFKQCFNKSMYKLHEETSAECEIFVIKVAKCKQSNILTFIQSTKSLVLRICVFQESNSYNWSMIV